MPEQREPELVSRFPDKARESIREAARKMAEADPIPAEEFGGSKAIFMANLEGYLGGYTVALLDALERVEARPSQPEEEAFREAVEFEVGCMEDYAAEKPGPLGKLAGEMAGPLRKALEGKYEAPWETNP